jgi:hypothetical protein
MGEVRDIFCEKGCGKKLGTVTMRRSMREWEWRATLQGYLCKDCAALEEKKSNEQSTGNGAEDAVVGN